VTLPVAGTVTNFNPLLTDGYAGKTGSDSAAGGCLAFFTKVTVRGRRATAVGVVMGQGQGSNTQAILAAAGEAAQKLVQSVAPTNGTSPPGAPGPAGAPMGAAGYAAPAAVTRPLFARSADVKRKHDQQEHT
jgi:hypothetical protein